MCSVNLRRFLGKNNKPENQEVNENNKEEIQQGTDNNWTENTARGIHQESSRHRRRCFHFTLIQLFPINIREKSNLSRAKLVFLAATAQTPIAGPTVHRFDLKEKGRCRLITRKKHAFSINV